METGQVDRLMIAFGPVPSRRLGRSLGINNIPPKICTYACVYCQLGRTLKMQVERQPFYEPAAVFHEVQDKVDKARAAGERIDFLTFVPDGEPTLDLNLGPTIALLKPLGIKIAIITNASLIWRPDVREDLMLADWVSLKVDSVREAAWHRIDRPHGTLRLTAILDDMLGFAQAYERVLVTETMLYEGNAFASTGDVEQDLLSITAVHPMREEAVRALLERARADWAVVDRLIAEDQLVEEEFEDVRFYMRRLARPSGRLGCVQT
jgi:wyosine [tRNA(Phe)-imidazoG37] synthetase (radical SAM superfamily)